MTQVRTGRGAARLRRTSVMTVVAMLAATMVTLFSPATASAAPVTETFQDDGDYAGTQDATISVDTPDPGDIDILELFAGAGEDAEQRAVVRWDLTSIPETATVSDASAQFTVGDVSVGTMTAYALTSDWDEDTVTWASPWTTPGGDYSAATPIGTMDVDTIGNTTLSLTTSVVQDWVSNPETNFGFVLVSDSATDGAYLRSSEFVTTAERPLLSVTYDTEVADPLEVGTSTLDAGTVGTPYSATLTATGGTEPYSWAVTTGTLPAGLTLDATTGVISGTPTAEGTSEITVTVTDDDDETATADLSIVVAAEPGDDNGGALVGITPDRVLDTRQTGPCVGRTDRTVNVVSADGVPADAAAVALNVTVVGPSAPGFLTVFPTGAPRPTSSNINYVAGQTVPNLVTTAVGTGGNVSLYGGGGCPHVVVDVTGYYVDGATEPGGFVGLTPTRALDTRTTDTCVSRDGRDLEVTTSELGVPNDAAAVALNVTVVGPSSPGFLTVFPAGSPRPTASNLNYLAGQTVANHVTTAVGTGGQISIYGGGGCPHVVVDVLGYFAGGTAVTGGFVGINPDRVLDTRVDGPCVNRDGRVVNVTEADGVPADAAAVVLNVTVTGSTAQGFLTVYPADADRPTASNLNYLAGQTVPNAVISGVDDGEIRIYGGGGCPNVIVDVVGYHVGEPVI